MTSENDNEKPGEPKDSMACPVTAECTKCPEFTQDDFQTSISPFEWVYQFNTDPFQEDRAIESAAKQAAAVGFKGFKTQYRKYRKSVSSVSGPPENISSFDGQPLELDTGEWISNDSGVYRYTPQGVEFACPHPIMPVERLKNINTGELKIRLAFKRGSAPWTSIICGALTVSSAKDIISLSKIGISVTSGKRAQALVDYIVEVQDKNINTIPEQETVDFMGWNDKGFLPYAGGIVYDESKEFLGTYKSIQERGDFTKWLEAVKDVRNFNLTAKIVIAASFASVLVKPCGASTFFVHLWGDTGSGKSVAEMVAASVWAEPTIGGDFFHTFKGTKVGFEVLAGFLHSLPVFVDELQLAKDSHGNVIFNVYDLASGAGKLRSNPSLGISRTLNWKNCFITSGEGPITKESDGGGAINRVIEVKCPSDEKIVEDAHKTLSIILENYGQAGRMFVEKLLEPGMLQNVHELYEKNYSECMKSDTTTKQAMAAAIIITGDQLADRWIFKDKSAITIADMAAFMKSKDAVSDSKRGYDYLCDWVSSNANKLRGGAENSDCYGKIAGILGEDDKDYNEKGWAYIIRSVFNRACESGGFSPRVLLSAFKAKGLIQTRNKGFTKSKRINGVPTECVVMKLLQEESDGEDDFLELPDPD